MKIKDRNIYFVIVAAVVMFVYFWLSTPIMMDDGYHYEGFAESLAHGKLDFKTFYGFQGLSFFSVPIFWLTKSHISIIIASMIFSILSIPLAYLIGREYYQDKKSGVYFLMLFLLMPYPYTTMMRGFQESALLFFILLIIYLSIKKKDSVPVAWAIGGVVKPFALVLFPLFIMDYLNRKKFYWLIVALLIGGIYLGASYHQTGHLVNNAAIGSYEGNYNLNTAPSLSHSFTAGIKGFLRVIGNLLISSRKIIVSPLVIMLGGFSLLFHERLKLKFNITIAIILNFLLVGSLTFSFSKYLLPMTTLFALVSIPYLIKWRWLMILVFIDSIFVFLPIWNYFGVHFWSGVYFYLTPLWLAVGLYIIYESGLFNYNSNS